MVVAFWAYSINIKCKLLLDNQQSLEEHEFNSNSNGGSWLLEFFFQTSLCRWSLRNLCNSIETNNSKLVTVNKGKDETVSRLHHQICHELIKENKSGGNENGGNYVEIAEKVYKFVGSGALVQICEQLTEVIQNQFKFNEYNDDDKQIELSPTTTQKWATKLGRLPLTNTVDYSSIFGQ